MYNVGDIILAKRTGVYNDTPKRRNKLFKGKIVAKTKNFYVVEFLDIKIKECYREKELKRYERL